MRRLFIVLCFFAVCAGCTVRGPMVPRSAGPTTTGTPTPTPTPIPGSLSNLTAFCQGAPAITLPGTYPIFFNEGVLNGTTYTIDYASSEFEYAPIAAGPSQAPYTIPPSASPDPNALLVDVWSGTVTYTGTPHNSTVCFLAAAYVNRQSIESPGPDNAEALGDPEYQTSVVANGSPSPDTIQNFALTITSSTGNGSFDLAGGGHGAITITAHGTISGESYRRMKAGLRALHR